MTAPAAPRLAFWHEFASTYSYLSAMRIEGLCREAGVAVIWRPFLLGPIFKAQGWDTSPFNLFPAKGRHMWRDLERRAMRLGLPAVARPEPFPQNGLLAARLMTIGAAESWGPAFARAVYSAQFGEGRSIDSPSGLAALLDALGEPGAALVERAQRDAEVKARLRLATEEARDAGLFGAPSFLTEDGEMFWGDDRLEDAIDWAQGRRA
ncbi:MAG: 2-hydroxychromene-2-carboxylate isomerase [Rubrimonas sp.]|uniref:2-hydroxychromene-2-carboxylate isomerase n=1 Tax=Rubrimonas sp. TaxID=2036015 RepID=UPI002FDC8858